MRFRFIVAATFFVACNSHQDIAEKKLPASVVGIAASANGVDASIAANRPDMSFGDTAHDFGLIHEKEIVSYDFPFTNTGKSPLIISSASGSCGCTVPDYPQDPIAPGKTGIVK